MQREFTATATCIGMFSETCFIKVPEILFVSQFFKKRGAIWLVFRKKIMKSVAIVENNIQVCRQERGMDKANRLYVIVGFK
ncbi:hypothetical protein H7U12_03920 [Rufibacter sp. H-1]|uniref:Uncharacterized protein n=1 Tax=Rufibacter sediminis TaxID=2762756 RepID=A0ABR6VNT3_9BACT|nr:hypothetical protein [Rufibacter sediminis]MBC3538813.1 hypothetical protein [Rufibacter sediminis]